MTISCSKIDWVGNEKYLGLFQLWNSWKNDEENISSNIGAANSTLLLENSGELLDNKDGSVTPIISFNLEDDDFNWLLAATGGCNLLNNNNDDDVAPNGY